MPSILAIDYGEKRVGLALAEVGSQLVLPFGLLERVDDDSLVEKIQQLISAENIVELVVGDPVPLKGGVSAQTSLARLFAKKLELEVKLPVHLVNEQLTSARADAAIAQGSVKTRDELAAMFMLQDYLERLGMSI